MATTTECAGVVLSRPNIIFLNAFQLTLHSAAQAKNFWKMKVAFSCSVLFFSAFRESTKIFATRAYHMTTSDDVCCRRVCLQGVSQLLKQSDWAQIQDFK